MRLFLILLIPTSISCTNTTTPINTSTDKVQPDTLSIVQSSFHHLLADSPMVLKAGTDYLTIATSPHDKLYFGNKFSPYKMEPYDIAAIEKVIDSLLKSNKLKGYLKDKSLTDFKYQIFSAKTANQQLHVRVQAICVAQAKKVKWNSRRVETYDGSGCNFNFLYNLTDKKIISFRIDSDA